MALEIMRLSELDIIKIKRAMRECDSFIEKEGRRDAALRPASAQNHLDFCKAHKIKLQKWLDDGQMPMPCKMLRKA